jgi:hypothetical protein
MATKLIELDDGTLVEVEVPPNMAKPISGGAADKIDASIERIKPTLLRVCKPVIAAWSELSQDMKIEGAEIELGFSFDFEGNIFLAKTTVGANIAVRLSLKPK